MEEYAVEIDMKWSLNLTIKAKNKAEAKKIAFKKIKKSDFNFDILRIKDN